MLVDRDPADQALVELELAEGLEQEACGADDLGADSVAGQDDYRRGCVGLTALHSNVPEVRSIWMPRSRNVSSQARASMLSRT